MSRIDTVRLAARLGIHNNHSVSGNSNNYVNTYNQWLDRWYQYQNKKYDIDDNDSKYLIPKRIACVGKESKYLHSTLSKLYGSSILLEYVNTHDTGLINRLHQKNFLTLSSSSSLSGLSSSQSSPSKYYPTILHFTRQAVNNKNDGINKIGNLIKMLSSFKLGYYSRTNNNDPCINNKLVSKITMTNTYQMEFHTRK